MLTGIILFIGSFWGQQGLTIALVMSILMNFASYFFSDKIALSMYHAQPVTREQAPQIYRILDFLCARSDIPMPKVYIIPDESPNAFATGRNPQHASVAITEGALRLLNEDELTGVLAHEISHVKNRDILISSVAATLAGIIMWVANMARFAAIFGGGRDRDDEGGGALGGLVDDHCGADRGHADPDVDFAHPRIPGGCKRARKRRAALTAWRPRFKSWKTIPSASRWKRLPARRTCLSCIRSPADR